MSQKKPEYPTMKRVYRKKTTKSRAGVKYTHYVPELVGKPRVGPNRAGRRKIAKWIAGAPMRERKAKHEKSIEEGKKLKRARLLKKNKNV